METYLPPKCKYSIEGNHIVTDGTIKNKVTGTAMGGILGVSPWSTPFQVACNLLGLATKDLSSKPAIKTGIALEGKIIRYAGETYPEYGVFLPAEDIFEKRSGDHDSWVSDFEDSIFGGHVDGIVTGDDGDHILEIKTSSNLESWTEGVPEYYQLQVKLYNYFLTGKDKAYVVLGMVDNNTYRDPASWVPNKDNTLLFVLDIDNEEFRATLEEVSKWYVDYVMTGTTPDYDPTNPGDVELYNHLVGLTAGLDEVSRTIDYLGKLRAEIAEYDAVITAKRDEEAELTQTLKEYLDTHALSRLDSTSEDYYAVLSTSTSSTLDEAQMVADGIDTGKYKVTKTSKRFSIKKSKKE